MQKRLKITRTIYPAHSPAEKAHATINASKRAEAAINAERSAADAYEAAYKAHEATASDNTARAMIDTLATYQAAQRRAEAARRYVAATRAANKEPHDQQRQAERQRTHAALLKLELEAIPPEPEKPRRSIRSLLQQKGPTA